MANWITSQELKENTSIGGNVDSDRFYHLIYDCQIMVLENVLGSTLYRKIDTEFEADTLADDYLTLFTNYIKPVLWHSVYADYLRDIVVLAQNTGAYTHTPEDATPSDLDSIRWSVKNAQSKADVYIDRMKKYLCDVNLSEYDNSQENDYDQDPDNINTITGLYFG